MRLIVMPLIIVGVALWLPMMHGRDSDAQSDRVRLFLTQVLEEIARDPASTSNAFKGSEPILVEAFRTRLGNSVGKLLTPVPRIDVRVGDFGTGSLGDATHTALAYYEGGEQIAVRVIARSNEPNVLLVGVFAPTVGEFAPSVTDSAGVR